MGTGITVCPFCQDDTDDEDMILCDECDQPVCVWCATTITSEDLVCPDCSAEVTTEPPP